jgi:hypothetical protein
VSANIPFWALNNENLKNFLEVNCGRSIPDESTFRKNYLSKCYNNILEMIRYKVHGKTIFVSIVETCDTEAHDVANVIIGNTKLVHVTRPAHALHRMTEEVRSKFPQVDALVSRTKYIFVKAPARKMQF